MKVRKYKILHRPTENVFIRYGIKEFKNHLVFALKFVKSLVFLNFAVTSHFGGSK